VFRGVYKITHTGYIVVIDHPGPYAIEQWYLFHNWRMKCFYLRLLDLSEMSMWEDASPHVYEVFSFERLVFLLPTHGNDHWIYSINHMRYCKLEGISG
jgi:hypothetical protein